MPRIATFTAPEKELRPSATGTSALELEGRRIGPLYQDIARNAREQGQLDVQKYKELLWPRDIVKLYEDRAKRATSGGVNVRTIEPKTTSDNTEDHAGHGQVSRGAGALGRALSDGGYALSDTGPGTVEYAGSNGLDYSSSNPNDIPYNYADKNYQKNLIAYNKSISNSADMAAGALDSYWRNYGQPGIPTGPVDSSGNPTGIDQYGNPTTDSSGNPVTYGNDTSTFWSGVKTYIDSSSGPSGFTDVQGQDLGAGTSTGM